MLFPFPTILLNDFPADVCLQMVARNGKNFLMGLSGRENANPGFNFLKPTHSLFGFFTKLCDAYSEVLRPPKGLMDKLQRDAEDRASVLERCVQG